MKSQATQERIVKDPHHHHDRCLFNFLPSNKKQNKKRLNEDQNESNLRKPCSIFSNTHGAETAEPIFFSIYLFCLSVHLLLPSLQQEIIFVLSHCSNELHQVAGLILLCTASSCLFTGCFYCIVMLVCVCVKHSRKT